jgi:diguanylate cyclase (GGDEF)-like protein
LGSLTRRIGGLSATLRTSTEDFYAVADLDTARRLGAVMWILGTAIVVLLLPISPPTESQLGAWAWLVAAAAIAMCIVLATRMLQRAGGVSPNELLASSYVALAFVAVLVALAGSNSPYQSLFLLSVLYTVAVHPPRRVLVYAVVLVAVVAAPLAYEGWDATLADQTAGRLIIWGALGFVTMAFTANVRAQRLALLRERQEATAQARSDPLTGLGNRRAFDEALGAAVQRVRRTGEPLCVIVADLDGFKEINDRWGHLVGDQSLACVAQILQRVLRGPDTCFRWGGDEFAILADTDLGGADVLRGRVVEAVGEACTTPHGRPLSLRLGAAELGPGMDADELMTQADIDLLAAKSQEPRPREGVAPNPPK